MKSPVVVLLVAGIICALGVQVLPWGADVAVHRGSVESFDIGVSPTGNLYAVVVGAADQFGGQRGVYVYRSVDYGHSWNLVINFPTSSLSNIRLVMGEQADLDLVHLFFANDLTHKILVRNLFISPDGRAHGFSDHTFGSSKPGRCFEVARSYGPLPSLMESDAYYIVAAQYLPVLNEIHVFRSKDYGGSWESVLTIADLAFGPVIEPEMALTWGAGRFFLVYPKDLEDADHWYDYSVFGTAATGGTVWANQWMVKNPLLPDQIPRGYTYPQICAASDSDWGVKGVAWVVLNTHDALSDTFNLEMWYWGLPPWGPAIPGGESHWIRQVIAGPSTRLFYSCLDVSSVMGPSDRDIYMLFDWAGSMLLYHVSPDNPVGLGIEGTGMNDHPYFTALDLELRPRVAHVPALPGAASCPGIAYSSRPATPMASVLGNDLYYDSSCTARITPHTTEPTEEWVGEMTAPSEEQAQRRFTATVLSTCLPTHSHTIEVTWSFEGQPFSNILITVNGPDGVLAEHESNQNSGSAILNITLPGGGEVTVTVRASDASHSRAYSESQSITLDPC